MTKRERVIRAICHEETDRLPHYIELGDREIEKMRRYTGNPNYGAYLDNDLEMIGFDGFMKPVAGRPGFYCDDFGACWDRTGPDKDIGVMESCVINCPEDFDKYVFPKVPEEEVRKKMKAFVENGRDTFKVVGISFAMYERGWALCGVENMLMALIEEPEFCERLFEKVTEYDLELLKIITEYDIDAICMGDDWGQQRGMIMGPELWRKFIKPGMKKLYEFIKKQGKFVIQHSCGDVEEIFEDLIEIGLDVYQTVQPEVYSLEEIKKKYGDRLSFWGGISTQKLLPFATPEVVKETIIKTAKVMGNGGGYILAPTHVVTRDVPEENIEIMAEIFKRQKEFSIV